MGLFDRFFNKKTEKQMPFLSMAQRMTPVYGEPPSRSTGEWEEHFNQSPKMNPVHQIASDVATSLYEIYDGDGDKVKSHPIKAILKKPCGEDNLTITEYSLLYITQVHLLLPQGEAFWIKERNKKGQVVQLWPVPPSWITEIPSQSKPYFTMYALGNMSSTPKYIPAFDMVYFKRPDVHSPYLRGVGRSSAVGDEIETDEYMAKYAKRFFFNNAMPPFIGMMPGADEDAVVRQKERWSQEYGSYANAHKAAWLNWDAKIEILKETTKEMDFVESRKYLRDSVNQHFCIPPELFGILENSNRSTIDAAYYLYTKNVLRKELRFIDDVINLQLMPEWGTAKLVHDNVVPEDHEFVLKQATEGLKFGAITANEWREANGYPKIPKGDIIYVPLNTVPTPIDQLDKPPKPQDPNPAQRQIKASQDQKKNRITHMLNLHEEQLSDAEEEFKNIMITYFNQQEARVMKESFEKGVTSKIFINVNWNVEDDILESKLEPTWKKTIKRGQKVAEESNNIKPSNRVAQHQRFVRESTIDRIKHINRTTKNQLKASLDKGVAAGEDINKLRKRVAKIYKDARNERAVTIAETEAHSMLTFGEFDTIKGAGIKKKQWLTVTDGNERASHAEINGQIVDIDEPFSNGLMYPGDPKGAAKEIIRCRCSLGPVMEDEDV